MIPPLKVKGLMKKREAAKITVEIKELIHGNPWLEKQYLNRTLTVPEDEVWGIDPPDPAEGDEITLSIDGWWLDANTRE